MAVAPQPARFHLGFHRGLYQREHLRASHTIPPKPPGGFRIVCVGDSVTFGYRVPAVFAEHPDQYDHSAIPYPMPLENAMRFANPGHAIDSVDMAVPGYTSEQGRIRVERDLARYQPDLVTICFGWNDVNLAVVPDNVSLRPNMLRQACWPSWGQARPLHICCTPRRAAQHPPAPSNRWHAAARSVTLRTACRSRTMPRHSEQTSS